MESIEKNNHHRYISICIILVGGWLSGCSDTFPISETTEKSLTETSTRDSQSNMRVRTVRIEGAWNGPEVIGSERVEGFPQNVVSGPDFTLDQSGAVAVSWQTEQYPNPPNGTPGQFKTTVLRKKTNSAQWADNSPIPVAATANTTQPKLQVHGESGITYATWYEFDTSTTFIRRFDPELNSWGNLHSLNTNFSIQLFMDKQGDATIVWPTITNDINEIHALRLVKDNLGVESTLIQNGSGGSASGYVTNDGLTRVFWFETPAAGLFSGPLQLQGAEYSHISGWGVAKQIPLDNLLIEFPLAKLIALYDESTQTTALIFGADMPLDFSVAANIYGIDNRNGVWSTPDPIDLNANGSNTNAGDYATNLKGEMIVVWSDIVYDVTSDTFFYYVKARQYSAQGGWRSIEMIGDPLPLTIGNDFGIIGAPKQQPQVSMNNKGEISVVWFDLNPQKNIDIFASHYSPNSGWGTQELVARTESTGEFMKKLDVQLNDKGQTLVMWREIVRDTLGDTHQMMLSQHNFGGTLASPPVTSEPLPTTPNPAEPSPASFSAPMNVWNNAGQDNVSVNVRGPLMINSPATNEMTISLINNRYYNSLSQRYKQGENIVLAQGGGVNGPVWKPIALPAKAVVAVEPVQLVFANDGTALLTWLENRDLYLSTSIDKQNWSIPVLMDNNVGDSFLLTAANGKLNIVWQSFDDDSTIYLRRYISGTDATAGLQSTYSLSFLDRQLVTSPISDSQGNVSVAWLSTTAPSEVTISTFNDVSQWQTSTNALSIGTQAKTKFQLTHSSENTYILVAVSSETSQLFASQYSSVGGWIDWQNIDQNQSTTGVLIGIPQVKSNAEGQVMVLWIEKTRNTIGQDIYHLLSNTLNLVNSVPTWSTPQMVGTTSRPSLRATPILQFADNGSAMAAWVDSLVGQQVLRFNQYLPANGWLDQPVDLVSYTGPDSGFMLNLNMMLTNAGKMLVTWQQLIRNNFGGDYHIWAIEGG